MPSERDLLDAAAAHPPQDGLLILDGKGREIAARPTGEDGGMHLIVLGPIDAMLEDGTAPAIRPGADGAAGRETAELRWLSHQRRREIESGRNKAAHALRPGAAEAGAAHGATSAPHGAPEAAARPDAAGAGPEARTAPEVRAI